MRKLIEFLTLTNDLFFYFNTVACVDLHNKLIIRYKYVHTFDKFYNGGVNRTGLVKNNTDAHNYDANSFLSKR
jgi:hypothetical protein